MNSDKLRFTGICIISISIVYLASALIYLGYETTQIRRMIPEVISASDKIVAQMQPIIEKRDNGGNVISDITSEVSAVRQTIPEILETVNKINNHIPDVLKRVDHVNQNLPSLFQEIDNVRNDIPIILDRTDNIIANAHGLTEKVGEQAGKGAVKGTVKGIIGLPLDAAKKVIQTPTDMKEKLEKSKDKSKMQEEHKPEN